jgi:hypothetical protein
MRHSRRAFNGARLSIARVLTHHIYTIIGTHLKINASSIAGGSNFHLVLEANYNIYELINAYSIDRKHI